MNRYTTVCPVCKGKGRMSRVDQTDKGSVWKFQMCYKCKGTGRVNHTILSLIKNLLHI